MATLRSTIKLTKVQIQGSIITFTYSASGQVQEALRHDHFSVDYFEDMTDVPEAIAAVVFAVNILPIAWFYDTELIIPELDSNFNESIDEFKAGFVKMYPGMSLKGTLTVNKLIDCSYEPTEKTALFFSGGLDATTSLINIMEDGQEPVLLTLWGADVKLADLEGWENKSNHTKMIAKKFGLESAFVSTEFRRFLDEGLLTQKVLPLINDGWWHGLHHGIGLIGHAAPYAYKHKLRCVYIAASYSKGEVYTCASDPTIDDYVRFGSCQTVHEGYNLDRQAKIRTVSRFVSAKKIDLPLIVCWESTGGRNCGHCEKCMRTAAGFIAAGQNPERFGITGFSAARLKRYLLHTTKIPLPVIPGWKSIQSSIKPDNPLFKRPEYDIAWLANVDLDAIDHTLAKRMGIFVARVDRFSRRVVKRLQG